MSGSKPPDSPPPEVPEEFAATYRAAYEQAMAAHARGPEQSGDREDRDEDPPRSTGPRRTAARVRDTAWFVPVLLGLLAALLIGAAYAVGRQLGDTVEGAPVPGDGPSLVLPGRDASGREVTYEAADLVVGRLDTAWRCHGTADREEITLRPAEAQEIGRVGLVPGYARTDEESGADRYAQNNRVTRVRGTSGEQVG